MARQNGPHFAGDIFTCIFLNENVWISINISLKFVPKNPINDILALVQIMAWRQPGDKPLSEPMMVRLPTHICVTRLQWVKTTLLPRFLLNIRAILKQNFPRSHDKTFYWMLNINSFISDVITYSCWNFNGGLTKHGWVITFHWFA